VTNSQKDSGLTNLPADGPHPAGEAPPFDPKPPATTEQTQGRDAAAAFAAEHERQTRAAHDAEIAAAGESTNIGTDGEPHFLKMIPHEGVDASEGDHNPDDFDYVCGSDGQPWPCPQAQELERQEQERRGEQPAAAAAQPKNLSDAEHLANESAGIAEQARGPRP
jgi:hypothetical protein